MNILQPFTCQETGRCCTNLKGKNGIGLMLFDDEVRTFITKGHELLGRSPQFEYVVKPEPKTKTRVLLMVQLKEQNCPFLKNNKCTIYEDRPLVCRGYPVQSTGLDPAHPGKFSAGQGCEGCQKTGFPTFNQPASLPQRAKLMANTFGDSYFYQMMVEQNNFKDHRAFEDVKKKGFFAPIPKEQIAQAKSWPELTLAQFLRKYDNAPNYLKPTDLVSIKAEFHKKIP